jgi:hypothetical protein
MKRHDRDKRRLILTLVGIWLPIIGYFIWVALSK